MTPFRPKPKPDRFRPEPKPDRNPKTETILEEAARIVEGTRNNEYGTPFINHSRTASFWSVYLGIDITPEQVCMLNILQKLSRSMNSITRDTLVDFAGYARNIEKIQDERVAPRREGEEAVCEHGHTLPHATADGKHQCYPGLSTAFVGTVTDTPSQQ